MRSLQYPLCPEILTPYVAWFSVFQKNVGKKLNVIKSDGRYAGCEKLVPHLYEHKDYAIHFRNLKFVKELGVEISDVSKIVSFEQKAWLEPYIDFNTDKRKEAHNDFEKDFFIDEQRSIREDHGECQEKNEVASNNRS